MFTYIKRGKKMTQMTERQKQIMEKAIKIIADDGIQNLTIKNLSRAVGVTEAALYRHYENKHAILMSILDLFDEFSHTQVKQGKKKAEGLEGIKEFVFDRYEKFSNSPELAKVLFSEAVFISDPELSERMRTIIHAHRSEFTELIEKAKLKKEIAKTLDNKSLFRIIVGSMRLLVTQWCFNNYSFDLKKEGETLWNNIEILIKR